MTAALVAALEGQQVLVLEHGPRAGGTTARSSGTVWVPDNPLQRRAGIQGDRQLAQQYLDALVGDRADRILRETFLDAAPQMIDYLQARTDVHFRMYAHAPDYRQELPGAALGGRPIEPMPFDGRTLGKAFDRLDWPLPELMLFGGMMLTRGEAATLLRVGRSWSATWLAVRLVLRFAMDRLRFKRGTRLVLGNALAGRLLRNLLERQVPVWFEAQTESLIREGDELTGLVVSHQGRPLRVRARKAVVMAGGGFPANAALRAQHLPEPTARYSSAHSGSIGRTLQLALEVGATLGKPGRDNALWFPSSIATREDGTTAVYPHIVLDRAKPGLVAVNAAGHRFVDEAVSYHEFCRAMYRAHSQSPCIPAWLVCDRRFLWKYGLGMIRPMTPFLGRYLRNGYLHRADSVEALAARIGVDPAGLLQTVRLNNENARTGIDPQFGRGSNEYDRGNGDPTHGPNPCLGPIETGPFYAVAVVPTPLGTSLGLATDPQARVLDAQGQVIAGLYACGNDMHSAMGGEYPGAGAQIGQAMTFGYLAAMHAARRSND
jgi:3-oxosteroid 1-dehydrogenase